MHFQFLHVGQRHNWQENCLGIQFQREVCGKYQKQSSYLHQQLHVPLLPAVRTKNLDHSQPSQQKPHLTSRQELAVEKQFEKVVLEDVADQLVQIKHLFPTVEEFLEVFFFFPF